MSVVWKIDIGKLNVRFAGDVDALLHADPATWYVTYGFRTYAEQKELYEKHLVGGPLAAPPGESAHEKGLAVDVTLVKDGHDDWNAHGEDWQRLIQKVHEHPRLHSLSDLGDFDHIEAVGWRAIVRETGV